MFAPVFLVARRPDDRAAPRALVARGGRRGVRARELRLPRVGVQSRRSVVRVSAGAREHSAVPPVPRVPTVGERVSPVGRVRAGADRVRDRRAAATDAGVARRSHRSGPDFAVRRRRSRCSPRSRRRATRSGTSTRCSACRRSRTSTCTRRSRRCAYGAFIWRRYPRAEVAAQWRLASGRDSAGRVLQHHVVPAGAIRAADGHVELRDRASAAEHRGWRGPRLVAV